MNQLHETALAPASSVLPLLRRTAAALRGTPDRQALAAALNEFMQLVPALRAAWIDLPAVSSEPAPEVFSPDALTLPLRAGPAVAGVLRHRLDGPPLDAGRLQVLGAVADLLGAILEQASQTSATADARALLTLVLQQVPCGAACFSPAGRLLAANPAAVEFAGGAAALAPLLWRPAATARASSPSAPAAAQVGPRVHLVRVGDRLGLVHLHVASGGGAADAAGAIALVYDLAQRARAFLGAIARETYRALWLARPLSLAVLVAPEQPEALLRLAEEMRSRLGPAAETGPMDADAVGILAPDTSVAALRAVARGAGGLDAVDRLRIGLAELERAQRTPEAFITAASGALLPLAQLRRPHLLLWDTSPSVTEALFVALHHECDAVRCHDREASRHLLEQRSFDAIFAKVELDDWESDIGFLQHALERQPGLKPFLVTDAPGLYSAAIPQLPPGTPVFRKPFQVSAVRNAVREHLAAGVGSG